MKFFLAAALLVRIVASPASPTTSSRTPVPDARLVMLAASRRPTGRAHGVLTGEMADAITKRFGATSPIYIDVTTEKRYPNRVQPPEGHVLAGRRSVARRIEPAPADDGLRHQLLPRRFWPPQSLK